MRHVSNSLSTRRYNGFGGKVEDGELPAQAAVRELKVCTPRVRRDVLLSSPHTKEECGIEAPLNHCGTLLFVSKGGPGWAFQIELYRSDAYSGTLIEFAFSLRPSHFLSEADRSGQRRCDLDGSLLWTPSLQRFRRRPMLFFLPYPMIPCGLTTFIGCHSSLPIVLSSGAPTLTPTHLVNTRCSNGGLASLRRSRKCNQYIPSIPNYISQLTPSSH